MVGSPQYSIKIFFWRGVGCTSSEIYEGLNPALYEILRCVQTVRKTSFNFIINCIIVIFRYLEGWCFNHPTPHSSSRGKLVSCINTGSPKFHKLLIFGYFYCILFHQWRGNLFIVNGMYSFLVHCSNKKSIPRILKLKLKD